jgi:tight adherence protein C
VIVWLLPFGNPFGVLAWLIWLGLLLFVAWWLRPAPPRARALAGAPPDPDEPSARAQRIGRSVRRRLRLPLDARHDALLGSAASIVLVLVAAAAALGLTSPSALFVLSLAGTAYACVRSTLRARQRDRALAATISRGLPDAIDLLAVAVGAGLTVPQAVGAVGARLEGPHGSALLEVSRRLALGTPRAEALEVLLVELGEPARPLVAALRDADRYGLPLGPTLQRLAVDARARRRRTAEAEARRIPVRLLFPLVLCTLPAFVLLTVVPLLAGSLGSLRPSEPSVDRSPPCCTSTPSSVPR